MIERENIYRRKVKIIYMRERERKCREKNTLKQYLNIYGKKERKKVCALNSNYNRKRLKKKLTF